MSNRTYLDGSITLCGQSDKASFKRTFKIERVLSEGGSVICYEASYKNRLGVLKEFYPRNASFLRRNEKGQLIIPKENRGRYRADKEQYLRAYELLLEKQRANEGQDIATFIPPYDVYSGCNETGKASDAVYIWTTAKVKTFEEICKEIRENPKEKPEAHLRTVLEAIITLTQCVRILHDRGQEMVHRDIKPSNFGFAIRDGKVLTDSLSLFDIDTVCLLEDAGAGEVMSSWYTEPEADVECATGQTDIYGIGATLFRAIIVKKEAKENGCSYSREDYDRLHDLVDTSELIQASEMNSHPKLRLALTEILEKCLAYRRCRYVSCEDLLKDLKDALFYLLPPEHSQKKKGGERWVLEKRKKALSPTKKRNSSLRIMYRLYERPLYQLLPKAEPDTQNTQNTKNKKKKQNKHAVKTTNAPREEAPKLPIRVLVIGFGLLGQKFLDACLQAGQSLENKLLVKVVSGDIEKERKGYLRERPALQEFFKINGVSGGPTTSPYGEITFAEKKLFEEQPPDTETDTDKIVKIAQFDEDDPKSFPNYVFIALGNDDQNADLAEICAENFKHCVVNYVREYTRDPRGGDCNPVKNSDSLLCPLYINEDIERFALHSEIERMAFNVHLLWETNLNTDFQDVRKKFEDPYNHDSSVGNVLSMKYKLHCANIDLEASGYGGAVKAFREKLGGGKDEELLKNELFNKLIWLEHRRWVTEKLCQGWRNLPLKEFKGVTKDEKNKRHICILPSEPNQNLERYFHEDLKKRNGEDRDKNVVLDPLDTMSRGLHDRYEKDMEAAKVKNRDLFTGGNIAAIRELIGYDKKLLVSFQEWISCMKEIWGGRGRNKVSHYEGLKQAFLRAAGEVLEKEDRKKEELKQQVAAFDASFRPVLLSQECKNWKSTDATLVKNIPFILSYSENACMVIPYSTGHRDENRKPDQNDLFMNVAAPTVLNPAKILYLCKIDKEDSMPLTGSVPYVMEYMRKKQLRADVEFLVIAENVQNAENAGEWKSKLESDLKGNDKRIQKVDFFPSTEALIKYLEPNSKQGFFWAERNETVVSQELGRNNFYDSVQSYRFDPCEMTFEPSEFNLLLPDGKTTAFTVSEMLTLSLAHSTSSNQPEFYEDFYKDGGNLWGTYKEKRDEWKSLCNSLGAYAETHDRIATFPKTAAGGELLSYILPASCSASMDMIVKKLVKAKCAGKGSCVTGRTSDSCSVKLNMPETGEYKRAWEGLCADVYKLMFTEAISAYIDKTGKVVVKFDDLTVSDWALPAEDREGVIDLLTYFYEKRYLVNFAPKRPEREAGETLDKLKERWKAEIEMAGKVSFTFASKQIKDLLTNAGKILEIYTYHQLKDTGYFDDVVSNYEIYWSDDEKDKNEFDLIATKGFRSVIIECKARKVLEEGFHETLHEHKEKFGINAISVLVADTQNIGEVADAGAKFGQVTVYKEKEIKNIRETIIQILEGTYT